MARVFVAHAIALNWYFLVVKSKQVIDNFVTSMYLRICMSIDWLNPLLIATTATTWQKATSPTVMYVC